MFLMYDRKPLPHPFSMSSWSSCRVHPLMEAISRKDVPLVALILAHHHHNHLNHNNHSCMSASVASQLPPHALHAAAASSLLPVVQLLIWVSFLHSTGLTGVHNVM
jgi:hypothetical protein